MFGLFFTDKESVTNFTQSTECNIEQFTTFFQSMLQQGVYLAPSAYEAGFMSSAHNNDDIHATITAAQKAFELLKR